MDFDFLYARNCSGCHGPDGKGGAAIGLGDPVYLAIADDAVIRRVTSSGVAGTSMPAFAQHSGGMLTDDQINVMVGGIRSRWAKPDTVRDAAVPPYAAPALVIRSAGSRHTALIARRVTARTAMEARASSIVDARISP